ncbi:MAG: diguanylate cyclase [Inhella sp.]
MSNRTLPSAERLALVLLAYALALAVSLGLARLPQALAPLWYANAVAVAGLLALPLRWAAPALGLMLGLLALGNRLVGWEWQQALLFLPANAMEIALGAWLLRSWGSRLRRRLEPLQWLQVLSLGALVPGLLGATLSLALAQPDEAPWVQALTWWTGSAAGAMAVLPLALLVVAQARELRQSLATPECWVALLGAVGLTLVVVTTLQMPYVFVALGLVLVGLWQGLGVTALATLSVSLLLSYALGAGLMAAPVGASSWSAWASALPLVALLLPPQLLAVAVEQLRAQQRRITAYYEHTPVMLASLDPKLRLRAGSEALVRWLGRPRAEVLGQPLAELLGLNEAQSKRLRRHLEELPLEGAASPELRLNAEFAPPERAALRLRALRLGLPDEPGYELVLEDLSEQVQMQEALQRTAYQLEAARRDALTELPLRAGFLDDLEQALARASFARRRLAVVFVDVDELKRVNDAHGHAVGDALLHALGQRLRAQLRPGDLAGRLGGDEFAMVLSDVHAEADPLALASRVAEALEGPVRQQGPELLLRVSVGVAVFPDDGLAAEELLRRADAAMYRAKGGPARRSRAQGLS